MKLTAETTVFNDDKVQSKFAELIVDADGIRTEVGKKVGNDEVISRINQSAESVQIQASKIEINGVINAINDDTTTTINGGKITTGTLLASAVKADSGQFNSALIPNLSADKITTGTINIGRLPAKGRADTYITEITGGDGIKIHDATNVNNYAQIDSSGLDVRINDVSYANYGTTSRIGKEGTSHIEMDYHSMQLKDSDSPSHTYFWVSDLRDENNEYQYTDKFTGDGTTQRFTLSYSVKRDKGISVTVSDGSGGEAYLDSSISTWLHFETAPTAGATITVTYTTSSYLAKAYTIGMRKANSEVGPLSTCFGLNNIASGSNSFAEGRDTKATGYLSHAEGNSTNATEDGSHAEGYKTTASGSYAHAEGDTTIASKRASHAEGDTTIASGRASHAEGEETIASKDWAHAEGRGSEANGSYSHAQNYYTIAGHDYQTAIGRYNNNKSGNLFEIGNGSSEDNRSNAMEVDRYGNMTLAGYLTIEGHSTQIGCIYSATKSVAISNTDINNNTNGASIDVPAGIYVVIGQWQFDTRSTTGTTNNAVRLYEGSTQIGQVREVAGAANWNSMQCCAIVETVGTSTTLKVCGASSRPYTTAQNTQIKAVRIA